MSKTPCEELGYKVGDKFRVVQDTGCGRFSSGSLVELFRDNGSSAPLFKLLQGSCWFNNVNGQPGAYEILDYVKPVEQPSRQVGALIDTQEKWEQMREGDVVEFVEDRFGSAFEYTVGKHYVVKDQPDHKCVKAVVDDDGEWQANDVDYGGRIIFKYVSLVDESDSEEPSPEPLKPKFKVGDKVRVIKGGFGVADEEVGTIVTITSFGDYAGDPGCTVEPRIGNCKSGDFDGYIGLNSFELVEDSFQQYYKQDVELTEELFAKADSMLYTQELLDLINATNTTVTIFSNNGQTRFSIMREDTDRQAQVDTLTDVFEILQALKACEEVVGKYEWL